MHDILLDIGVATFIVYAIFNMAYVRSMKRMSDRVDRFLNDSEGNLNSTLVEMKGTLVNIRKVTQDMSMITDDVREIADSIVSLERGAYKLYQQVQDGVASTAEANLAGLKAGIKTGVVTLAKNMYKERGDDHERRAGN